MIKKKKHSKSFTCTELIVGHYYATSTVCPFTFSQPKKVHGLLKE